VLNPFRRAAPSPHQERLRSLSLFVDLSPSELRMVEGLMHERTYLANEVVFDEGEEGHAIYIVLEGEVAISRTVDGKTTKIAQLGMGTFFGELALLDGAPRSADARAVTNSRLAVFFREDFLELLDTHGRVASKIARQLARHIGGRMREMALSVGAYQHL
jgi:CRP/FNR family cyclic AMP-dependent transcriptional regulator